MIESFPAVLRGFERDGQLLLRLGLSDELAQLRGPQFQSSPMLLALTSRSASALTGERLPSKRFLFRKSISGDGTAKMPVKQSRAWYA